MNEPTVKIARYTDESYFDILIEYPNEVKSFLKEDSQIDMSDDKMFYTMQRFGRLRTYDSVFVEMMDLVQKHLDLPDSEIEILGNKLIIAMRYGPFWRGSFAESENWDRQ